MRVEELMGTIDEKGQLHLDEPLIANQHTRVKVIVMFVEEIDEDDESKEALLNHLLESF